MANYHSTGSACLAKTLACDDLYTLGHKVPYFVCEPGRTPYSNPVPEAARRMAKNVRLLRASQGWSQEELAEIAGLDRSFVGAIERAERNITLATAEKLANAFNVSVADLLIPYRNG